ncbi:Lar family restriction alleviation protein [Bilophila wadsworthia]|uniref:Lar family restriction alleviation protein n=1 Tax=Bilophila wadsworthia TaxID=35833 RepID=UPI00331AE361
MSEELTLLPCPACGHPAGIARANGTGCAFVMCQHVKCAFSGPIKTTSEAAVAAWNALPRALTWTTEPPNGPGYYWCRYKGSGKDTWSPTYIPACADHTKYTILFKSKDVEWAGPIPEPREPK